MCGLGSVGLRVVEQLQGMADGVVVIDDDPDPRLLRTITGWGVGYLDLAALTVTGGVITSAGLALAATFSVLTVLPVVSTVQQGILVAVGVLLDTFLIRCLLVPAVALRIGPALWWPSDRTDMPAEGARP